MSKYQHTMENLRQCVITEYNNAPAEVRSLAHQFFNAMDRDGSGSVDYREFQYFLVLKGFGKYADTGLFRKLDRDGNSDLDFWEVMSLYYIIRSEKPFCCYCDDFLLNAYSVCNDCPGGPFYFCNDCYQQHINGTGKNTAYPAYTQPAGNSSQSSAQTSSRPAENSSQSSARKSSRDDSFKKLEAAINGFNTGFNLAAGMGCSIM